MASVRLTHIPTGFVQSAQTRSRENSFNEAKSKILEQLDKLARDHHLGIIAKDRKDQVGSGMRGDKVRTYRFQDNTVTDHVSGKSAPCDRVMRGGFELLWR